MAWGAVTLMHARNPAGPVALIISGALTSETVLTKTCPFSAVNVRER